MNSGTYTRKYIWQQSAWPHWRFDAIALSTRVAAVHIARARLLGRMAGLGFDLRDQATLRVLSEDVLKTSAIEGERLNPDTVRSSVARRLGVDIGALAPSDRHVDGVVEMVLDATAARPIALTQDRLFAWHRGLFPNDASLFSPSCIGCWRNDVSGPMQVVSGPIGRQKIHFEAPPAAILVDEMKQFLNWFNADYEGELLIKAGLAHLWFVTLHPFDDGNGRIARAVGDMVLASSDQSIQRFYSLSAQILHERNDYYRHLESAQKGTLDVTEWLSWFLACLYRAIVGAEEMLSTVMEKAMFWQHWAGTVLNERQINIINRLLDGFEGKLTSSKWAAIAKCSPDTALRDANDLIARGLLRKSVSGGRSTSYELVHPKCDEG